MARILVIFGTSHGHTARVVERLAGTCTRGGHEVTVRQGDRLSPETRLEDFDAVLVAGSVQFGRHQRYLEDFARQHAGRLTAMPSAFLSVCGALMGTWPRARTEAQKYVDRFAAETGWLPHRTWSIPGALQYTRYGMFIRWVMKFISMRTGRPTDTSRDYDFTDWDEIDRIAREFTAVLPTPAAVGEV